MKEEESNLCSDWLREYLKKEEEQPKLWLAELWLAEGSHFVFSVWAWQAWWTDMWKWGWTILEVSRFNTPTGDGKSTLGAKPFKLIKKAPPKVKTFWLNSIFY